MIKEFIIGYKKEKNIRIKIIGTFVYFIWFIINITLIVGGLYIVCVDLLFK